jgi:hypothetical protein
MNAFLWTMLIFTALEVIGKVDWLSSKHIPARTAGETALGVCIDVALIAWIVWLLAKA